MASRGSFLRKSNIILLSKLMGSRVIIHLHGAEFQTFYHDESNKIKRKYIRSVFDAANVIVVLSTQWAKWVCSLVDDKEKVVVVYNAVPSLEVNRNDVVEGQVLFLGRLGKRKGVDDLIIAFEKVVKSEPEAKLLLGAMAL